VASALAQEWTGRDVRVAQVEAELARLRQDSVEEGSAPFMRTSVMTHMAWVPPRWLEAATATLEGLAERHPSRTVILVPDPKAEDGLDADLSLRCFALRDAGQVCSEVIQLRLRGSRADAPASIVEPLLLPDLPVFLRWRGLPPFADGSFEQLVRVTDRLIVDSTEWPGLPGPYGELAGVFEQAAVSDIAWARTERWRHQLASLWPEIARVQRIRVKGTAAQAYLLCGWLRSRLGRNDIAVEHDPADRLQGVQVDGEPAPFPPGDPPLPSDVLSDELDTFVRNRVYEDAVRAAIE
jgi:glucose-6-phosphate dehydrogenase assembly protein OpcA